MEAGGWAETDHGRRRAALHSSPMNTHCGEFLRGHPFAALWSLPAGMWLTGLSCPGLVVAGKDWMAQCMEDPMGPRPHVPVG